MSVYSELLQMALVEDSEGGTTVPEMVALVLACRAELSGSGDPASRISHALAYDLSLLRLCDDLGVPHNLTGRAAGPEARRQAEERLVERLPLLGEVMALDNERQT